jgi:toxin YoeB
VSENVSFTLEGLDDYIYWQTQDQRTLKKINKLIEDIIRNGNEGIGHPEPLKHDLSGKWSREIDKKNRLVYRLKENGDLEIHHCKGHYN